MKRIGFFTAQGPLRRVFTALILMALGGTAASGATPGWPGGDTTVDPGADFYAYANGAWTKATEIPADRAGFSTATMLTQAAEAKVRALLEATASSPAQGEAGQVGAYYRAFMNEDLIERQGRRPLSRDLARIRRVADRRALAALMGRANAGFQGSLFALEIDTDSHDSRRAAIYVGQGGLGLPDRDAYLAEDSAGLRSAYQHYIERLLSVAGWPQPRQAAADVLAFEIAIARVSWAAEDRRDESRIYNPTSPQGLAREAPGFPWSRFLAAAGLHPRRVVLRERSAVIATARLFATTSLPTLKAWAAFHLTDNAAPDLSHAFADAGFDFHERVMAGAEAQAPRWRLALKQVSGGGWKSLETSRGAMGDAVGRLYISDNFDPSARETLETLIGLMKATLRERIILSDRMSTDAKAEALRKVDSYQIAIGGPQRGDSYQGVRLRDDDLYGDVARVTAHNWALAVSRLDRPVDRGVWAITPQTVNAYNDGALSMIVFTAALLQPPFFDAKADPAVIYGSVGATIGHELTHGFDDQGRRFDARGQVRNWWTTEDDARFDVLSARLVDHYGSCEAAPGLRVNGRLTLGENLADVGGLQLALAAYHATLHGKPAPIIDGLTGDQRFFLAFATARRDKRRLEAVRADTLTDPHTPDPCRVNAAVGEVDGWYEAFDIQLGDALFVPMGARARVW